MPSEPPDNWEILRSRIIGFGEQSIRKSYYPELQRRLADLELFRTLLEHSLDAIFLLQIPSGQLTDVTESACSRLGYSREELLSATLQDLVRAPESDQIHLLLASGEPNPRGIQIRGWMTKKDGGLMPSEMTLSLVELRGSAYAVAVVRDITDRQKAELALQENEARYRLLAENASDLIFTLDMNLRFTYISPSVERLRGYTAEEVIMKSGFDALAPGSREAAERAFQKILEREANPATDPWVRETLELELLSRHSSTIWAETTFTPIRNKENKLTGFLGISRDITERRKAAEIQKMLESQLAQAQKMESIGTLAGGIAHDFNNILSAIIGYTELAMEDIAEPEVVLSDLKDVLKAGDRARTLISQILTFSRKADISYAPMPLHSAVKESLKLLRSVIPATIEIHQDLADSGFVLSHPTHIHQIIMNLCTNAAHAMEKGGGALTVALTPAVLEGTAAQSLQVEQGDYLRLSISDTGHGMTPEIIERIFDPYFTTKASGRGTGLGLAVVHGIVKSHGGAIRCKSIPDAGTTFEVYLPKITPIKKKRTLSRKCLSSGTERILFVDDEAVLADIAEKTLGKLGYQMTVRTSSVEALELFRGQPDKFDLVITDMTMPVMTGDSLARKIVEIRPDIPIILCTGYSRHILGTDEKPSGVKALLQKPLKALEWSETIRKVLDGAKSNQAPQS